MKQSQIKKILSSYGYPTSGNEWITLDKFKMVYLDEDSKIYLGNDKKLNFDFTHNLLKITEGYTKKGVFYEFSNNNSDPSKYTPNIYYNLDDIGGFIRTSNPVNGIAAYNTEIPFGFASHNYIEVSSNNNAKLNTTLAANFFNELSEDDISNYLIENSEALLTAFGLSKDDEIFNIGTAIYNTLQGGATVSVNMTDGGIMKISGHFDEDWETENPDMWNISIVYEVPKNGTNKCFPNGSKYSVKGGTVKLTANPAEITNTMEYDVAVCVYSYQVDITGVTISDGINDYTLDITGLIKETDWDNPCIIDPNAATWTITLHNFKLPGDNAKGTVKINGEEVMWKDIKSLIN